MPKSASPPWSIFLATTFVFTAKSIPIVPVAPESLARLHFIMRPLAISLQSVYAHLLPLRCLGPAVPRPVLRWQGYMPGRGVHVRTGGASRRVDRVQVDDALCPSAQRNS